MLSKYPLDRQFSDVSDDEGVAYAEKLKAAGVVVELVETVGTYHGFDIRMEKEYSKRMLAARTEVLKKGVLW